MRYLAIGILALSLGGCATGAGSGNISDTAKQIQETTRLICKFVPTITTIVNILSSGSSGSIGTIANDICAAVTNVPLSSARGAAQRVPKLNGIPIKGKFVR